MIGERYLSSAVEKEGRERERGRKRLREIHCACDTLDSLNNKHGGVKSSHKQSFVLTQT